MVNKIVRIMRHQQYARLSFFVLILILFSGCSSSVTLSHKPQLLHFSTPEVTGGWLNVDLGFSVATFESRYDFGSLDGNQTVTNNQISSSKEQMRRDATDYHFYGWLGLLDSLDFYMDSPGVQGLKIQLLGGPRLAREEGLKLSLEARLANVSNKDSNSDPLTFFFDSLFGADSIVNTDSSTDIQDISCNVGYRYNPNHLVYINTFANRNKFSGRLWYDAQGITRTAATNSESYGVLLGYSHTPHDQNNFILVEAGATKTTWDNRGSVWAFPIGVSVGHMW